MTQSWKSTVRCTLPLLAAIVALFCTRSAFAAPTLEKVPGDDMPQSLQTNQSVSFKLRYTDSNGDPIKKADAIFTDESASGNVTHNATDIDGTDTSKGVTITWQVNGFAQGAHKGHFQVTPPTGTVARFPAEATEYFSFGVEAPWLRWVELFGGILICLFLLPFTTYLLFRSLNPRSDPSRAARGALFLGILAVCALFVYLFAGPIGLPITIGIAVVAAILGLILVFAKR